MRITYFIKCDIRPEFRVIFDIPQEQLIILSFLIVSFILLFALALFGSLGILLLPQAVILLLIIRVHRHLIFLLNLYLLLVEML